jgi:hypothetical protein
MPCQSLLFYQNRLLVEKDPVRYHPKQNPIPGLSVPSNTALNLKYLQILSYMVKNPLKYDVFKE